LTLIVTVFQVVLGSFFPIELPLPDGPEGQEPKKPVVEMKTMSAQPVWTAVGFTIFSDGDMADSYNSSQQRKGGSSMSAFRVEKTVHPAPPAEANVIGPEFFNFLFWMCRLFSFYASSGTTCALVV
jgi:hypothetical protein